MTATDWIIVALAVLLAANGLRQGFIIGVLQLAGFAAGAFAGSRLGPVVLSGGSASPYAPLMALAGAVLLGSLCAALLERVGAAVRMAVPLPFVRTADAGLGAVLGALLGLGMAWIAGAVLLQTPGLQLRRDIQRSVILRRLNDVLPPSGFVLNALARFDPLPSIKGPGIAGVRAPQPRIAHDPQVRAAAASVVRVLGTACGLGVEGSGWVAGDGLVVTNAHVVAGESDTIVEQRGEGPRLPARVVLFAPHDDLALLRVPGLGASALPLAPGSESGASAAVLGFPHNGPYDVRAARLGPTQDLLAEDAYGRGPVRRSILSFRGLVRSGNSGGPLVDAAGRVAGTVFAAAVGGGGPRGGYAVPAAVVRQRLAAAGHARVSTGPCAR
jgi:S1-C subfamily serine protease